jgi:hypothetical protein
MLVGVLDSTEIPAISREPGTETVAIRGRA